MDNGENDYLNPEQVTAMVSGMTEGKLAQRRYMGLPPRFYKPTPKTVLYKRQDIIDWIEGSAQTRTGQVA
ncbi:hypothetical protein GCM10009792_20570 [Microcella alkalica]|uniref:Uncharacterized protein n=1 Tax=Microcella alkalica TaxID=355930 RepID=A0A839E4V6_9MICO|nr:hypothetical protein [Microcella alkalica]MBA8847411.1 hypothetical protein [Microcella alkalica]